MRCAKGRGQATAELAILLPVLALILLGALDLGRVFSVWLTLSNGTREGARYVANTGTTALDDQIRARTRYDISQQGLPADDVVIDIAPPNRALRVGGTPVTVTARYSVTLATTYLFGARPVAISARTQMVVLPDGG